MKDQDKTKEQLIGELESLRHQNTELRALESEHKQAKEALQEREERLEAKALTGQLEPLSCLYSSCASSADGRASATFC